MCLQYFCVVLVFLPGRTPSTWGEILQPPTHFTQYFMEGRAKHFKWRHELLHIAEKPHLMAKILPSQRDA